MRGEQSKAEYSSIEQKTAAEQDTALGSRAQQQRRVQQHSPAVEQSTAVEQSRAEQSTAIGLSSRAQQQCVAELSHVVWLEILSKHFFVERHYRSNRKRS